MKFCSTCGHALSRRVPAGDNRERFVCEACGTVHYQNPKIVAGCIPLHGERVLLCRRAIEPRRGRWTLPAGFMENAETALEAAVRETWEEARARVAVRGLHTVLSLPHVNQVYMMYLADLLEPEAIAPGEESLEVALFTEQTIPWRELAFPTIEHTLRFLFADRREGGYRVHTGDVIREGGVARFVERREAPPPGQAAAGCREGAGRPDSASVDSAGPQTLRRQPS